VLRAESLQSASNRGHLPRGLLPSAKEIHLPAKKRPTFLKRQKELQRVARATEKREARRARKHTTNLDTGPEDFELLNDAEADGAEAEQEQQDQEQTEGIE
jgi:hypothetical protein